jgi:hypothetical protein
MAFKTTRLMAKRENRLYRMGRKRKNLTAKRSTLSEAELFACLDAPPAGKPAQ